MKLKKTNKKPSQLGKIIDGMANGHEDYFFWTVKAGHDADEIYYLDSVLKITGYDPGEIKHFPVFDNSFVYEEDLPAAKRNFSDFLSDLKQESTTLIYRIKRKDGKIIWIKENISIKRDEKGKSENLYAIVCDITRLKEKEITFRKELKSIKEVNASKDKFISILSHDLRAPFTSILGFSEILMNEPNLSKAERHEYLSYINDSAQHQLQLINYLLDWSRLQTGRIKIEPKRLNAQSIIFNCVSSLTGNAIRKNIDIKVNVDESIYVQSDERLLTQVITNLLSNAIKFSRDESSIIIYCNLFNDEFAEFVIKDHGIGISEKNKTRLFKIENMFSTEGTKGEKGTGLGLSLVKEIIEKHGGEIWFYSEPEKGSEFHFTIPRSPNSILLVEDVKGDRLYYEKLIKDNFKNFQVISVSNGFEAINTVFQKLPSLIITDHEMPLMNGSQLVENIRKEDSTLQIPIIVIATNISDKLKMTYRNLGVHQILKKPVDAKLFIEMVNLTLSEENFIKHI